MEAVNENYQIKEGKQKIFEPSETCPHKNRTASEGYVEGQIFIGINRNNTFSKGQSEHKILEYIPSPTNLNKAYLS
jgi:RNA-directed DNA polymerase